MLRTRNKVVVNLNRLSHGPATAVKGKNLPNRWRVAGCAAGVNGLNPRLLR
jgi:hypothetical protein